MCRGTEGRREVKRAAGGDRVREMVIANESSRVHRAEFEGIKRR
jgi:hypothetical protein